MTGFVPPDLPVPSRVMALEARFNPTRSLGAVTDTDIASFQRRLETVGGAQNATLGAPTTGPTPSVTPMYTGSVVNADGTLAADVPYADLFRTAGAAHGIQPSVLAAVAKTESAFDPNAVSPAGALGLMQFMPGTAAEMGVDPYDPASAIDGAARYLSQNLRRFGSLELALAAYNAGPGAVQTHGGIPPFAETQAYVPKVLAAAGIVTSGASS